MIKKIRLLFPLIVLLGIAFSACQKQNVTHQQTIQKVHSTAIARTDNKDYKIPKDTAVAWTTRWRTRNEKELGNKMPNSFLIPINGLHQLEIEAAQQNTLLSGVRVYLSVNAAGEITVMYVPAGLDGNDIVKYTDEMNFSPTLPYYDGTAACPPSCDFAPNILNNTK